MATGYHHQNKKSQKSCQKVDKKLSKSCQKVVTNFVSTGKNQKKVNRPGNKNKKNKKKIIGMSYDVLKFRQALYSNILEGLCQAMKQMF
jgi:hypothetical protein